MKCSSNDDLRLTLSLMVSRILSFYMRRLHELQKILVHKLIQLNALNVKIVV